MTALEAVSEALVVLTACTLTVLGFGRELGAVKSPVALMVPTVEFPPATPPALQVTAVVATPFRDAENCCVEPARTLAVPGEVVKFDDAGSLVAGLEQPIAARKESRSTEKYGRESFGIANPQVTPLTRRCWKSCTKRTDQPMGCLSNDQSRGMLTQQRCNTTGLTDRKKPVSAWGVRRFAIWQNVPGLLAAQFSRELRGIQNS